MYRAISSIDFNPKYILKECVIGTAWAVLIMGVIGFFTLWSFKWVNPTSTAFTHSTNWDEVGQEPYSLESYWVPTQDIPEHLKWAVVASEDQRYWEHNGIDLEAIGKALQEMENGERVRGASTITQQLVKNLFLSSNKTYFRKGVEAGLALTVEKLWSKERILELYLNVVEFGPGVYGVGKASEHFFAKEALELKADEAARLAAVLPNPKRMRVNPPSPYVAERKEWILRNMMNLSGIAYVQKKPPKPVFSDTTYQHIEEDTTTSGFEITYLPKANFKPFNLTTSEGQDSTKKDSVSTY